MNGKKLENNMGKKELETEKTDKGLHRMKTKKCDKKLYKSYVERKISNKRNKIPFM